MSLPFDPAQVAEYAWMHDRGTVIGVGLTLTGGRIDVIQGARLTREVKDFVTSKIGPPDEGTHK